MPADEFRRILSRALLAMFVSRFLYFYATRPDIGQHLVDAQLVDDAQPFAADPKLYPAVFTLYPEPALVQVGQEAPFALVVGVGNVVPRHGLLSGYLADP